MRKLILIAFLFFSFKGWAQTPTGFTKLNSRIAYTGLKGDSILIMPTGADTPRRNKFNYQMAGQLELDTLLHKVWYYSGGEWHTFIDAATGSNYLTNVTASGLLTSSGSATPNISSNVTPNKLVGRYSGTNGIMQEIKLGPGLSFSNDTLKYTSSINGTVTSVTSGHISNFATTYVSNSTTTPAISFVLDSVTQYKVWGRSASGLGVPSYINIDTTFISNYSTKVRPLVSLTTTGTSGAATYNSATGVFNIPQYSFSETYLGTVTSVGLSLPSEITVTNSPVTNSGTLTGTWASQSAYKVFARGATSGTPSFLSIDTTFIANFSTKVRPLVSLTTSGSSGAATYNNVTGVFNIPQYQAAGTYVTQVTADGLLTSSGGTTPNISSTIAQGKLAGRGGSSGSGALETISVGGILSFSGATLLATEVDGSTTNELQTISASGSTSPAIDLSLSGGSVTFNAGTGISLSRSSNTITITGTNYTASNGLTLSSNNVKLGGSLIENTTIDGSTNYNLSLTGNYNSGVHDGVLKVTNSATSGRAIYGYSSSTGGGSGVYGEATTSGSGVVGVGTTGNGIFGYATSGTGVRAESVSGPGIVSTSTSSESGVFVSNPSTTNTDVTVLRVQRNTSGTAANNIGAAIQFNNEYSDGSAIQPSGMIVNRWTNATYGSLASSLSFQVYDTISGLTDKMSLLSTGQIKLNTYGIGTHTGTAAYNLSVDASGNVIETAISSLTTDSYYGDYRVTLNNGGGSFMIKDGAGISLAIGGSGGNSNVTITAEDTSATNEIQTFSSTNDGSSLTWTLANGGSLKLIAGNSIYFTIGGTSANPTITIGVAN